MSDENENRSERERERENDRNRERDTEYERQRERDRQSDRDRDPKYYRDYQERPSAISLFLRLGYDITNNDDVQRLASDLRWASERRKQDTEARPHRLAFLVSGMIAVISVALTVFGQWVLSKLSGKG